MSTWLQSLSLSKREIKLKTVSQLERNNMHMYSHGLHNDIWDKDGPHKPWESHKVSTVQSQCVVGYAIWVCVSTLYDVRTRMKSPDDVFLGIYPYCLPTCDWIANNYVSFGFSAVIT